jgi:hypothetical protein
MDRRKRAVNSSRDHRTSNIWSCKPDQVLYVADSRSGFLVASAFTKLTANYFAFHPLQGSCGDGILVKISSYCMIADS